MSVNNLPPQNIEAEESILGGILLDPEAIGRVADLLLPEALYIPAHRDIYKAALALHRQGKPTDLMSVTSWLYDHEILDKIGGQSKLAQLVDRTVSAVNIDRYANLVIEKHLRRQLIKAGNEIVQLGYENAIELESVFDQSEQKIFGLTQDRPQDGLISISRTLEQTFQEIETRHGGQALPGLLSGFYDLDAMTSGFQRSDFIVVAGRPSMGKCLAFDSELVLDDGSISNIESIYQQYQINQAKPSLLTLGENWRFHGTQPSAFLDDGIKPVFRVTTVLGRQIETTLTHPFLTIAGWQSLSKLCVGDKIALPRQIAVFGKEVQRSCEIKLLAYFLGDGCLTQTSPRFTNVNSQIQDDFIAAIKDFSPDLKVTIDTHGDRAATLHITAQQRGAGNPLTQWLRKLEVWGKNAHHKTIPNFIFRLEKELMALFLNRLLATDGWISVLSSGQVQAGYATVSEKLARQVQHLLLRFGVIAKLKHKPVKYKQELRHCWQLDITDALSLQTLINEIGIFGKEDATNKAKLSLATKRYQTNTDLIPVEIWHDLTLVKGDLSWKKLSEIAGINSSNIHVGKCAPTRERLLKLATAVDCLSLQNLADGDIYWDKITSIEFVGEKQVYDLTIPKTHNFVANDICVHNTALAISIARSIAGQYELPVAVFSLEMSREQLVQRMLASEAGIESNYLRAGRIAQNQWETLNNALGILSGVPIFIDDTASMNVMQMRSQTRRLQAEHGGKMGLILIDYLQLMEGNGSDNRVQEISKITRSLKGLARELNVPVIALSQLSRSVEARTNKRPMMSDLRESGSIEQDADVVIMLYRDEYYNPDTPDRGIAEIIITKHRNGPTGVVKLLFDPQFTRFRNIANTQR